LRSSFCLCQASRSFLHTSSTACNIIVIIVPVILLSYTVKKELAVFPSPAGMSLIKLFLGGNNIVFSRPERVWSVTSRLGTGKWLILFYSVWKLQVKKILLFCSRYNKRHPSHPSPDRKQKQSHYLPHR
jgi:hypothetical protein